MSRSLFELMDDMHLSAQSTFLDYYNAMSANNVELAQQILNNNPELADQITNSENINRLIEKINKNEEQPKKDIDDKLDELEDDFQKLVDDTEEIGAFSSTVQYYAHNFVTYQGKHYFAKSTPPIGTLPTNANYWQAYDIKGFQGFGGLSNVNYRGNWDSTVEYNIYDSVVYNNKLWWAVGNNINNKPSLNHYPWNTIGFPMKPAKTPIQKEQPTTGYSEGDFWFKITEGEDVLLSSWTSMASQLVPTYASASFIIDNIVYIIGGLLPDFTPTNTCQAYDIQTNTWSMKANYPMVIESSISFALNDVGYLIGGLNSRTTPIEYYDSVYTYNPTTNTWTKKNNFPIKTANVGAGTICNGKAYVNTGLGITSYKDIYVYNEENDSWAIETSFPTVCVSCAVGAIGNKLYFIGGDDAHDGILKETRIYDITTKTWSFGKDMITPRSYVGALVNGNYIYVCGGFDKTLYSVDTVEQYDAVANTWRPQSPMQYAKTSPNGVTYGSYGYIIGGFNIMQPMVGGYVERFQFDTAR